MKETRQGTMELVQVHVELFTTTQRPNESVEAYYKLFCTRRDTVNAHGGEAGFHKELYAKACEKVMAERNRDETLMTNAAGNANVLTAVTFSRAFEYSSLWNPSLPPCVLTVSRRAQNSL